MTVLIRKKLEKAALAKGMESHVQVYTSDGRNWVANVTLRDLATYKVVDSFYSNGFVLTKKDAMYWVPRLVEDAKDAVEAMDSI